MNSSTIFTPVQTRRNRKAIAAAIAEHGDTLTAASIETLADSLAAKYVWEVRRDAFRDEAAAALIAHVNATGGRVITQYDACNWAPYGGHDEPVPHVMASRAPVAEAPAPEVIAVSGKRTAYSCAICDEPIRKSKGEVYTCHECHRNVCENHSGSYVDESNHAITQNSPTYCSECRRLGSSRPVKMPTIADFDVNPGLATTVTYTDAPEGMAAVIVSQHVDLDEDQGDWDTISRLEDELTDANEEVARLKAEILRLEKELIDADKAVSAMAEMQDYEARYGSMLHAAIDRASIGLTCDTWEDEYVRKDIMQVIKLAEEYAGMIGDEVNEYIRPQA